MLITSEQATRDVLAEFLRGEGFDVAEAAHGHRAVELLVRKDLKWDLVVTELSIPAVECAEIVMHANARSPPIPVLLLASGGAEHAKAQARLVGTHGSIPKPVDLGDLLLHIWSIFEPNGAGT